MGSENILAQGIETLYTMKENVLELDGYKQKSMELAEKEEQLEKQIHVKEKEISDEIAATVKKRRMEIEESFDEQTTKVNEQIKKVQTKKEKEKDHQVSKRIKEETSDLTLQRAQLKEEMKSIYEKNHISKIYNNFLFHALYLPRTIKDVGIILITVIITLLVVPVGFYMLLMEEKTFNLILVYFICVLLFGGLYLFINSRVKEKYAQAMKDISLIRKKQQKNKIEIRRKTKSIYKDKDESIYELDKFQKEIEKLEYQLMQITEQKKEAMIQFESKTKDIIGDEIRSEHKDSLEALKMEQQQVDKEEKEAQEKAKMFSIEVINKYELILGKDLLNIQAIDKLISYMQENKANSIGEAISVLKKEQSSTLLQ